MIVLPGYLPMIIARRLFGTRSASATWTTMKATIAAMQMK
jgi:hypothetical protein